jgi:hypothetical protein
MSEAYEDLGGKAATAPAKPETRRERHKWRFVQQHDKAIKHYCVHCGTVRVRIAHSDRFPTARFTATNGRLYEGKAPPCPPPNEK